MDKTFISYEDIFENYEIGDSFYDKELMKYELIDKSIINFFIKELVVEDDDENIKSIYNYTKLTRILISMGINKRLKKNIFWNKTILLTEECGKNLISKKQKEIVNEYKKLLDIGLQNGIINQDEFEELIKH